MLLKEYLHKYNLSVQHFAIVLDRTLNNTARYVNTGDPMPHGLAEFTEKLTDKEVTREELLMPDKFAKPVLHKGRMSPDPVRKRQTRIKLIALLQKALRIEEGIE